MALFTLILCRYSQISGEAYLETLGCDLQIFNSCCSVMHKALRTDAKSGFIHKNHNSFLFFFELTVNNISGNWKLCNSFLQCNFLVTIAIFPAYGN
ncbi:MAG: hypothetical protein A2Y21_00805 [Clostridiales bacterium GWC2_40_7]|nr:MAG: hypothetical protein A2Y21_00805 [Clostridiales bacterium GWC2_40_7]